MTKIEDDAMALLWCIKCKDVTGHKSIYGYCKYKCLKCFTMRIATVYCGADYYDKVTNVELPTMEDIKRTRNKKRNMKLTEKRRPTNHGGAIRSGR